MQRPSTKKKVQPKKRRNADNAASIHQKESLAKKKEKTDAASIHRKECLAKKKKKPTMQRPSTKKNF